MAVSSGAAYAMASIHETAESPHAAGVMDRRNMRRFGAASAPGSRLAGAEIRALREREGASQACSPVT